jgi:hypothetical protein
MVLPDWLNYEKQMKQHFDTLTTIKDVSQSVFNAYPVRVRTQQPIAYYEIGARNIDENGEIVLLDEDMSKERANISAYEAQMLQEGDIIIPFRNKRLHTGLYIISDTPMVPNPSLLVIRSGSLSIGRYLLVCLQQPFIIGYLEYLAQVTGKVEIESVLNLLIPTIDMNFEKRIEKLENIIAMRKQQERIMQNFKRYEEMLSAQSFGNTEVYSRERLHTLRTLLDETEILSQTLKNSIHIDEHISLLNNNFREIVNNIE